MTLRDSVRASHQRAALQVGVGRTHVLRPSAGARGTLRNDAVLAKVLIATPTVWTVTTVRQVEKY